MDSIRLCWGVLRTCIVFALLQSVAVERGCCDGTSAGVVEFSSTLPSLFSPSPTTVDLAAETIGSLNPLQIVMESISLDNRYLGMTLQYFQRPRSTSEDCMGPTLMHTFLSWANFFILCKSIALGLRNVKALDCR